MIGVRLFRKSRAAILMYHRVAWLRVDPWQLAVAPDVFADQLDSLARKRELVTLADLVERAQRRRLTGDEVAITFDDGYADNLEHAAPILGQTMAPATLFLLPSAIERGAEFWWDRLARLVLTGDQVGPLSMAQEGGGYQLGGDKLGPERQAVLQAIWSELRLRPVDEIYATLDRLAAGVSGAVPEEGGPLKAADLDQLTKAGFTFGGHTLTHPPLSKIAPDLAAAEIASGKEAVKQMIGAPISGFAYPYGDCHAGVARQVAAAGFSWACTTHAAAVANGCDPFLLPRVKVGNISGKELLSHLSALRAGPG